MGNVFLLDKWRLLLAIMADPALSASAKNAAFALLSFYNNKSGRCFPSYETLGARIGLQRRATINAVNELVRRGLVRIKKGGGRSRTNAFVIRFDEVHSDAPFKDDETVHNDAPNNDETVHESAPFTGAERVHENVKRVHENTKTVHGTAPKHLKNNSSAYAEESWGGRVPARGRGAEVRRFLSYIPKTGSAQSSRTRISANHRIRRSKPSRTDQRRGALRGRTSGPARSVRHTACALAERRALDRHATSAT